MLHIWDAGNEELTVIKDETAETFKAKILASANDAFDECDEFDYDVWLEENQYTLIDAGDVQKEEVSAFIQW